MSAEDARRGLLWALPVGRAGRQLGLSRYSGARSRGRGAVVVVLAVLVLLALGAPAAFAATGSAYVTNFDDGTVSVIDTATNTVTATINVGSAPDGVAVNPAGTRVYVTDEGDGTVSVIDTATNTVTATTNVGSDPNGVAVNPAGTLAYVTNDGDKTVSVIDTTTNTVTATINVGSDPGGVAVNPAGTLAYVTNDGDKTVSVIDTATNTVTATINVGSVPDAVAVSPAGTRVYVTNQTSGTVSVIDAATNTVTATITVGAFPFDVAVNPAGTSVYVADAIGTVSVIDAATNSVTATVTVDSPSGVAVNPAGTSVYVTNENSGTVSVLDAATNTVTATITVGGSPVEIAVAPASVVSSPVADVSLTKSAAPTGSCSPAQGAQPCVIHGQDVTYTLTESNPLGPDVAASPTIVDTLPAGQGFVSSTGATCTAAGSPVMVTCPTSDLAVGATATVTIEASTSGIGAMTAPLLQTDSATETSTTADPDSSNDSASAAITVVPVADVSLTKSAAPLTPPGCSAAQAALAGGTQPCVVNGGDVVYTLIESNAGPDGAAAPTVSDTLPAGQGFVSSTGATCTAAGSPVVVTCPTADLSVGTPHTVTIEASTSGVGALTAPLLQTDHASVSSTSFDPNGGNDDATASIDVLPVPNAADVSLTKSAAPTGSCSPAEGAQPCVLHGQDVTYTLTESNSPGPDAATAPTIVDTLPVGEGFVSSTGSTCTAAGSPVVVTCPTSDLAVGKSHTVTIEASTSGIGALGAPLLQADHASVSSTTADPDGSNNDATADITVVPVADVSLTKSALPVSPPGCTAAQASQAGGTQPCVLHGADVVYTLTESNPLGPDGAASPTVVDMLPSGEGFVSSTGAACTAAGSPVVVSCPTSDLAVGATATVTIEASTSGIGALTAPLLQSDSASVSSTTVDPIGANNDATVSIDVLPVADVSLTKSALPVSPPGCTAAQASQAGGVQPCVLHGQDVTYALTESNPLGPDAAASPTIVDALPSGEGFVSSTGAACTAAGSPVVVSCPTSDLGVGATATVTIEASTSGIGALSAPLLQSDSASVSSTTVDPNGANNDATASIDVLPIADVSLTKSALPVSPPGCTAAQAAQAGGTQPCVLHGKDVVYTLIESNAGPDRATAPTIADTLPAGQGFVSSDDPSCAAAGTLPAAVVVTCPTPDLPSGSTVTVKVEASTSGIGALTAPLLQTDQATVSSATVDPSAANNAATASIDVLPAADVSLTKSAAALTPPGCTAAQASQAGGTQPCVLHGKDVVYTLIESNAGPDRATAPTIADTLPAGQAFVSSTGATCTAAGSPVVVTCPTANLLVGTPHTVTIETSTTGIGSLTAPLLQTDHATVSSATVDPSAANNDAAASIDVLPVADLSLTKSALPVSPPGCSAAQAAQAGATQPCVLHGQNATYALADTNNGLDPALAPKISDTLPAGQTFVSSDDASCTAAGTPPAAVVVTCPTPDLPSGSTVTINVVASTAGIPAPLSAPLLQTDHGSVSSMTIDPNPNNNAATATITVIPAADLALTKTSTPDPVIAGQQLEYTLVARNLGPDPAVNTKIVDTLPAGEIYAIEGVVELVKNTITGGVEVVGNVPSPAAVAVAAGEAACTPSTLAGITTVTCALGTLPSGSNVTVTLLVIASPTAGPAVNNAVDSSDTADPNPASNVAATTTTVSPECTSTRSGTIKSAIDVETGTFLCLTGATVTGTVQVDQGAGLVETNSTSGPVQGETPVFMTVCNSTINGAIVIHNATELVRVGDDKDNCAPNTVKGSVTLDYNTGGAAGPAIDGNKITGSINCKTNLPVSTNEGVPNTVGGSKLSECAAL
jgi:uncharacterized repeat protein (TIGR01451 family)